MQSKDTLRLYLKTNKLKENLFGFIQIDKYMIIELLKKIFGSFYNDLVPKSGYLTRNLSQ